MNRRELLRAAAAAGLTFAAKPAWALGDASKVDVVEIVLPSGTTSRPEAWRRLLYELEQTTSIVTVERVTQSSPGDVELFNHPFAVLQGDGAFDPLSEAEIEQLRRYLTYGGFLYIDDTSGRASSGFDDSVRRLCGRLFPTRALHPLPADHSVYRAFFLLERPAGRVALEDFLSGITVGEISPLIYGRNDLSGALARGPDGRDRYAVIPGGAWQRREAIKLSINLMLYALTSNYKKDQAHVTELINDGRLFGEGEWTE